MSLWTPTRARVYTSSHTARDTRLRSGPVGSMWGCCMERVRFITHQGRQVLLIDHSNSTVGEILKTLAEVESLVQSQAQRSVLTLCDFTGAEIDKQAADRMKVVAAKDRPYVRRSAFVGTDQLPDVYYRAMLSFSARDFPSFKTREEALDWLVAEEEQQAAS